MCINASYSRDIAITYGHGSICIELSKEPGVSEMTVKRRNITSARDVTTVCVCARVQVHCSDAANTLRQTQELTTYVHHAGTHLVHLGRYLAAYSRRYELHRATRSDADPLYLLQRRVPHLLIDDVILHPVCRHRLVVLAHLSRHSQSHATPLGRRHFRSKTAAKTSRYLRRRQSRERHYYFLCGRETGSRG